MPEPIPSLHLHERAPWRLHTVGGLRVWLAGVLFNTDVERLAAALTASAAPTAATVEPLLRAADGHFALVVEGPGWVLAAVDPVRSIPLFHTEGAALRIGGHAGELAAAVGATAIDPVAARCLAMGGFTIGADTVWQGVRQLRPGQYLLAAGGAATVGRYRRWTPWLGHEAPRDQLRQQLADLTLAALRKMADSADGRTIVVPLSAGLDSRCIVSGLRAIGYDNVRCFAYGLPGNWEATASRRIAAKLGYDWRFVPLSTGRQRAFFQSELHRGYVRFADTGCATPFIQDLLPVHLLMQDGYIAPDAVIVNGQSGDFITGNHIPAALAAPAAAGGALEQAAFDAFLAKHFRLWRSLASPANDALVVARLRRLMAEEGVAMDDPATAYGVYEFLENDVRQAKYVVNGQRCYEYLGLDWRLPLWDSLFLDFYETAPLSAKVNQSLYREMLLQQDWGGVWAGAEWKADRYVSPGWMRVGVRPFFKLLHAPLGRERWHRFERRFLAYWMEITGGQALRPYWTVAGDRRGARHFVAWHTEAYLADKGLRYDGTPA